MTAYKYWVGQGYAPFELLRKHRADRVPFVAAVAAMKMRDFLLLGLKYLSIINEIRASTDSDRICYLKKYKLPAAAIAFGCNLPTIRAV